MLHTLVLIGGIIAICVCIVSIAHDIHDISNKLRGYDEP